MKSMFLIRFLIGGLIIASMPLIAQRIGGKLTGLLIVFPTLIVLSFLAIGQNEGSSIVRQTALGAMWGLPALVIFFIAMYLLSTTVKQSYLVWIGVSLAFWAITALLIIKFEK